MATPDPLYVRGDFNTKDSTGTSSGSDTAHTKPSSLVADAVTVLSNGWSDGQNATSSRRAGFSPLQRGKPVDSRRIFGN